MRSFLLQLLKFAALFATIICLLVATKQHSSSRYFRFLTNSVSYNCKAKFIENNKDKLNRARYVIIGSSMSMNNINGPMLEDSLNTTVINLASWGMKPDDFRDFPIWQQHKKILFNMHFTDFGASWILKKRGYPLSANTPVEAGNILLDYPTYRDHVTMATAYCTDPVAHDYNNLHFDRTGGVLFEKKGFLIDPKRWGKNTELPDDGGTSDFIYALRNLSAQGDTVLVFFSPGRRTFYSAEKSAFVDKLSKQLRQNCPHVLFFNHYNEVYDDSLFVDNCHFSHTGADLYTSLLLRDIRQMKVHR